SSPACWARIATRSSPRSWADCQSAEGAPPESPTRGAAGQSGHAAPERKGDQRTLSAPLVASLEYPLLASRRSSYVPGVRPPGIWNAHEPAAAGAIGVCVQLT